MSYLGSVINVDQWLDLKVTRRDYHWVFIPADISWMAVTVLPWTWIKPGLSPSVTGKGKSNFNYWNGLQVCFFFCLIYKSMLWWLNMLKYSQKWWIHGDVLPKSVSFMMYCRDATSLKWIIVAMHLRYDASISSCVGVCQMRVFDFMHCRMYDMMLWDVL